MSDDGIAGFWSYAHDDNRSSREGIVQLAKDIAEEYDLLTGQSMHIFVDRNDISWGDNWRERVDANLAVTTFFIPIITPRYFNRSECRRELVQFFARAKSLGLEEFILPILYVSVPSLDADNPDELVALIARTHYVDWRTLRLVEPSSGEYRNAVHNLAMRLIDIEARLSLIQVKNESIVSFQDGEEDLEGLVSKIRSLLPDWSEALATNDTAGAQNQSVYDTYRERESRLRGRRAPQSALMSNLLRFSKDTKPLVDKFLEHAQIYSARSIELDPLITATLRLVSEYPAGMELISPICDAIEEGFTIAEKWRTLDERHEQTGVKKIEFYGGHARLSRTFKELRKAQMEAERLKDEGDGILNGWHEQLSRLQTVCDQQAEDDTGRQ